MPSAQKGKRVAINFTSSTATATLEALLHCCMVAWWQVGHERVREPPAAGVDQGMAGPGARKEQQRVYSVSTVWYAYGERV